MGEKRRIVILIDWYLPGTKAGGPVRSLYSMLKLMNGFFDFFVITKNTDLGSSEAYKEIIPNKWILNDNVQFYYFDRECLNSESLVNVINSVRPALVYCNSFWSYHFSILPVRLKKNRALNIPVLLAPRGMLGKGAMSLKPLKKNLFIFAAKLFGWYKDISFHATQELESKDIKKHFKRSKIFIAPNVNSAGPVQNTSKKTVGHLRLFYLSRVARVKNLHFALECLKGVNSDVTLQYDIFGNLEETEYWDECQAIISSLPPNITVSYRGELAFHEVQATISTYNCLFLPTLNENFGHSIVESLFSGCPIIISDQTPWSDVSEENAGYAISLSEKTAFSSALHEMAALQESEFRVRSQKASDYISKKIDRQLLIDQYKNLFNDSIKNGSGIVQ
jgi:glycosyltransferase involved in cell wall biosynthesis